MGAFFRAGMCTAYKIQGQNNSVLNDREMRGLWTKICSAERSGGIVPQTSVQTSHVDERSPGEKRHNTTRYEKTSNSLVLLRGQMVVKGDLSPSG
jgi:hypothetical protein